MYKLTTFKHNLPCRQGRQKLVVVPVEYFLLALIKRWAIYKSLHQIGNTDWHLQCDLGLLWNG